jgi:hypothetical protein
MSSQIIGCAVWTDANKCPKALIELDTGVPASNLIVEIFEDQTSNVLVGSGDWTDLPQSGSVSIIDLVGQSPSKLTDGTPVRVHVERKGKIDDDAYVIVGAPIIGGNGSTNGSAQESFDRNLLAYPFLTTDGRPGAFGPSGPPTADTLGAAVDEEIRVLLGRVPADDDVVSITSALQASFQPDSENGVDTLTWLPPTAAATTRMGSGVTGLQANLATVAQAVLQNALRAVPGLQPLWMDDLADPQEIEADKDILLTAIKDFLNEVGTDGGPSTQKVNVIVAQMKYSVADLGIRLGMRDDNAFIRDYVVTPDDELALTEYIITHKAVQIASQLWTNYQPPAGTIPADLGTRFFLLEQALSRSSELVDEVYTALGSLYIDRQLTAQTVLDSLGLTIDQVFGWVKSYITDEAFALVQQAGVRGAALIGAILGDASDPETMIGVIAQVQQIQADPASNQGIPEGFFHPRAVRPVNELLRSLVEARDLAKGAGGSGVFTAVSQAVNVDAP